MTNLNQARAVPVAIEALIIGPVKRRRKYNAKPMFILGDFEDESIIHINQEEAKTLTSDRGYFCKSVRKFRDYAIRIVKANGEVIKKIMVTDHFYLLHAISCFCLQNDWGIEKMPQRIFHYATVRGMFTPARQLEITDLLNKILY